MTGWFSSSALQSTLKKAVDLREEGRPQEALEWLAAHAGLETQDLSEPERIDARLQELLTSTPFPLALFYRDTLAGLLIAVGLRDAGVLLLERAVGLEAADFAERTRIAAKLKGGLRGLRGEPAVFFVFRLANFLELADRHEDQLAVLEAWVGLGPDDPMDRDRLGRQIDQALAQLPRFAP